MTNNHEGHAAKSPPERERVDAYWLALDSHALVMAALPISKRGNARRSQVERASVKAFQAIGLASNGDEQEAKDRITTAFNAADSVLILMQGLVSEGRVKMEAYAIVSLTANRLLARLRELAKLPLSAWPMSASPPTQVVEEEETDGRETVRTSDSLSSRLVVKRLQVAQEGAARLIARLGTPGANRDRQLPRPVVDEAGGPGTASLSGTGDSNGAAPAS